MNSTFAYVLVVAILSVFIPTWSGAFPRDRSVILSDNELRPIYGHDGCNIDKKPVVEEKSSAEGFVVSTVKQPEDSDKAVKQPEDSDEAVISSKTDDVPAVTDVPTRAGFVPCQYEEATEDVTCQQHCLPKGYSYGLCVGNKCSCV